MPSTVVAPSPIGQTASIASIVLGALGVIGTILQIVSSIGLGAMTAFGVVLRPRSLERMGAVLAWTTVANLVTMVLAAVGLILCLAALSAGIYDLVKRAPTLVAGVAGVVAAFDLLVMLPWPVLDLVVRTLASVSVYGADFAIPGAISGAVYLVLIEVWSVLLLALWVGIATLALMERRRQSAVAAS